MTLNELLKVGQSTKGGNLSIENEILAQAVAERGERQKREIADFLVDSVLPNAENWRRKQVSEIQRLRAQIKSIKKNLKVHDESAEWLSKTGNPCPLMAATSQIGNVDRFLRMVGRSDIRLDQAVDMKG
jgi:hypothetical protein